MRARFTKFVFQKIIKHLLTVVCAVCCILEENNRSLCHIKAMLPPLHWQAPSSRSITTPPRYEASPSQDTQHKVTKCITTPPLCRKLKSITGTHHKVTGSITTPPGWNVSSTQSYQPDQHVHRLLHLYTLGLGLEVRLRLGFVNCYLHSYQFTVG